MNPHYPMVAERAGHRCEECLQMNRPAQLQARQQWMRLKIFLTF